MEEKIEREAIAIDRISQLPEDIIHNILQFLSTKDVVRLGALSKTWQHLSSSFPISEFSDSLFGIDAAAIFQGQFPEILNKRRKFMNFVGCCLSRQCELHACIPRFRLCMSVQYGTSAHESLRIRQVDSWIELAAQNHVQELDVHIIRGKYQWLRDVFYCLPQTLLSSKSLNVLKLEELADLRKSHSDYCNINLPCLRVLSLNRCWIDEKFVENLSISCPKIEDLTLIECSRLNSLQLSGFGKLKKVKVVRSVIQNIEIAVPSLEILHLKDRDSRLQGKVDVDACKNLRVLKLIFPFIDHHVYGDIGSRFPLLEVLVLEGETEGQVKISSRWLDKLRLAPGGPERYDIIIEAPVLCSLTYASKAIPSSFSINSPTLQDVRITLCEMRHDLTASSFLEMSKFLGNFNHIEFLKLWISSGEVRFTREDLIKDVPNLPFPVVKCLCLEINYRLNRISTYFNSENLIEGLLWMVKPECITLLANFEPKCEFTKLLYEKAMHKGNLETCCNSCAVKCWRHSLKDFRIQVSDYGMDDWVLHLSSVSSQARLPLTSIISDDINFLFEW